VGLTLINLIFINTVFSISGIVLMFSVFYMRGHVKEALFYIMLVRFVLSIAILIIASNPFVLFIGWEGLGVSSFILIISYHNKIGATGGVLTLINNRLGDALFIFCISYWLLQGLGRFSNHWVLFCTIVILSSTKRAQWPFINWLPAAIAAPTPIRALVHSSTLVTAGVWLILRINLNHYKNASLALLLLGTWTLLLARFSALVETDYKKIVALSTLRQLGLIVMSFSLGSKTITFLHIIIHAFSKARLFLITGRYISYSFSEQRRNKIARRLNIFQFFRMVLSLASLTAIMFLAGFYSKELIFFNWCVTLRRSWNIFVVRLLVAMTAAYCINLGKTITTNTHLIISTAKETLLEVRVIGIIIIVVTLGAAFVYRYLGLELIALIFNRILVFLVLAPLVRVIVLGLKIESNLFNSTYKSLLSLLKACTVIRERLLTLINRLESAYLKVSKELLIKVLRNSSMIVIYVFAILVVVLSYLFSVI